MNSIDWLQLNYLKSIHDDKGSLFDDVVNYGMQELYEKLDDPHKSCISLCESVYFTHVQNDVSYSSKSSISNKKYIYIPMHFAMHFSLVCIVQLECQNSQESKKAYVLRFDSINDYHLNNLSLDDFTSTINRW